MNILSKILHYKLEIISAIVGGFGGYAYWYYIGCSSGTCPITAKWYTSAIYGVVMGFLLGQIIREQLQKKTKKTNEHEQIS